MGDPGEIAKTARPLVENLAKLTGPMCEELGLYFGERVRAFRERNLRTIVDRSVGQLEATGRPIGAVPPRLLLPILESASLENNPTLQEMWSGLLASASDQADKMSPSYVETLRALTPIEARSMKVLYDFFLDAPGATLGSPEEISYTLTFGLDLKVGESIAPVLLLETLERLGLIRREYDLYRDPAAAEPLDFGKVDYGKIVTGARTIGELVRTVRSQEPEPLPTVVYHLAFTSYGIQFMRSCEGPVPSSAST
jgi:hypothetical protein